MQRSPESGSENVIRRDEAFLPGVFRALGLIQRSSKMHEGSEMAALLWA
jgi:hypothetical protein